MTTDTQLASIRDAINDDRFGPNARYVGDADPLIAAGWTVVSSAPGLDRNRMFTPAGQSKYQGAVNRLAARPVIERRCMVLAEPNNSHDPNARRVCATSFFGAKTLGYVPRDLAAWWAAQTVPTMAALVMAYTPTAEGGSVRSGGLRLVVLQRG